MIPDPLVSDARRRCSSSSASSSFSRQERRARSRASWLASLGQDGLSDSQAQALVLLRDGEILTNATYRNRFLLDSRMATHELGDLVRRGLVEQQGSRRWATYRPTHQLAGNGGSSLDLVTAEGPRRILGVLEGGATPTRAELAQTLGDRDRTVLTWLNRLRQASPPLVQRLGPTRSPDTRYRITPEGRAALASDC